MNEQFSILIDSRTRFETGKPGGEWLSIPTTAEQLHAAMKSVGITAENPQDFFINGFANTEKQPLTCCSAKLLAEALRSLPEEKRETILLYYFFDMSETEISRLCNIPRTTVKYRRNSSFDLLKRYLEERAYDCTDW